MCAGITFIRWKEPFSKALRYFTKDSYDAIGINIRKTFTVFNIYNGRKPKWWIKCTFEDFRKNPHVDAIDLHPFDSENVSVLRMKIALSSTIAGFSTKKISLKTFIEAHFIHQQPFEERVGYLFLCEFLSQVEDNVIHNIQSSSLLLPLQTVSIPQKDFPKSLDSNHEVNALFNLVAQLCISYPEYFFEKEILSKKEESHEKEQVQALVDHVKLHIVEEMVEKEPITQPPTLDLEKLVNLVNKVGDLYHLAPIIISETNPRGCIIHSGRLESAVPIEDQRYCYLTDSAVGIETLPSSKLLELRRILDSTKEFSLPHTALSFKINEELSKR